MSLITKWVTKVVREDTQAFYTSGALITFVAFVGFGLYKMGDVLAGGHFGHIVEVNPGLQWLFQFAAFIGLGFAVHFFIQYRRARHAAKQNNGASTVRIKQLADDLHSRDEEIRVERERFRKILDTQVEFITKFLPDGTITFINRSNYEYHGYKHWSEVVGKNLFDLLETGYVPELKSSLATVTPKRPRERHVQVMLGASGEVRYVDWINCGLFDKEGKLVKYQAAGRDITAHIHEYRAVKEREKYYRMLFTHMLSGFAVHRIICDDDDMVCDYAFVDVNPAFEKLFGFAKGEVLGKTVLEIMPNTEPDLIIRFGQVAETGVPDNFECRFIDVDKWFNVTAFKPQPEHFAATFIDITDRKDRKGKHTRREDEPLI